MILAALGTSESRIDSPLLAADCLSTLQAVQALGATSKLDKKNQSLTIQPNLENRARTCTIDCGNSGTTARLLLGVLSALPNTEVRLIGDSSLENRPMGRIINPLMKLGANFGKQACASAEVPAKTLPLTISGKSLDRESEVKVELQIASAQLKSALLLSSLVSGSALEISLPDGSRDHTEKMFQKWIQPTIHVSRRDGIEMIKAPAGMSLKSFSTKVPGDPSSAAFMVVAALLSGRTKSGQGGEHIISTSGSHSPIIMTNVMTNKTRTAYLEMLKKSVPNNIIWRNSTVDTKDTNPLNQEDGKPTDFCETTKDLEIEPTESIKPFHLEPHDIPAVIDEIPILSVAACFANGQTVFRGLGELRVKESDRLKKTKELLQKAGVPCQTEGDDLIIEGMWKRTIRAFAFDPEGDHRMAMAAEVLATQAQGKCSIREPECVNVSFPSFHQLLDKVMNS